MHREVFSEAKNHAPVTSPSFAPPGAPAQGPYGVTLFVFWATLRGPDQARKGPTPCLPRSGTSYGHRWLRAMETLSQCQLPFAHISGDCVKQGLRFGRPPGSNQYWTPWETGSEPQTRQKRRNSALIFSTCGALTQTTTFASEPHPQVTMITRPTRLHSGTLRSTTSTSSFSTTRARLHLNQRIITDAHLFYLVHQTSMQLAVKSYRLMTVAGA